MYTFGELWKGFRKREGLDQLALADAMGVSRNTISNWERSENLPQSRELILKLAETLQLSPADTDRLLFAANYPLENRAAEADASSVTRIEEAHVERLVVGQLAVAQMLAPPQQPSRSDFYTHVSLPPNYVPRTEVLAEVRAAVLGTAPAIALTSAIKGRPTALHGMGGTGKSVVARALCDDPDVQAAFPDGILWATLGLLNILLALLTKSGATHMACAFDHVIESFRNDVFPGYKTSAGQASDLLAQFAQAEQAIAALGVVVWPMVEFEADDALASAALRFRSQPGVVQAVICSPDKDLAQLVSGDQVVCWDRRPDIVYNEAAVLERFGVRPLSIPDWLALVGDSADGYPGLLGWGQSLRARALWLRAP